MIQVPRSASQHVAVSHTSGRSPVAPCRTMSRSASGRGRAVSTMLCEVVGCEARPRPEGTSSRCDARAFSAAEVRIASAQVTVLEATVEARLVGHSSGE